MNIEKQVWLVDTLRRNSAGLTFGELSSRWMEETGLNPYAKPLQKRTLHRYQNEILDLYGIAIRCNLSGYRYYIDYSYGGGKEEVTSWLLDTISMDNMIRENRSLHRRILLERHPKGERFLPAILLAMKEGTVTEMTYCRFDGGEPYTALLSPYFVKSFAQRWYVTGLTPRHPGELRTYALDRITGLRNTDGKFTYPEDFDPEEYFSGSFGIYHGQGPEEHVEIKVTPSQSEYLRSLPLHPTQKEVRIEDGHPVFGMELRVTEDFIREIMRNGPDFEVLEPQTLRNEIIERTRKTFESYGSR